MLTSNKNGPIIEHKRLLDTNKGLNNIWIDLGRSLIVLQEEGIEVGEMGLQPEIKKGRGVVDELDERLAEDVECVVVLEDGCLGEDEERDVEREDVGWGIGMREGEVLGYL